MRIGELDQRVTVESPNYKRDGGGDAYIDSYSEVTTRWAKVVPTDGSEGPEGEQLVGRQRFVVTLRQIENLTTKHRLHHRSRYLEILSIGEVSPRSPYVDLACVETKA